MADEIQNGDVFADRKNAKKRRLVITNAQPNPDGMVELRNEKDEARHFITLDGLHVKFKFVGRYLAQPGTDELLFVPAEKLGSALEASAPAVDQETVPGAVEIVPERTANPEDPPLTEQGVIAQAKEEAAPGAGSEVGEPVAGGLERFQFTNAIPDTDDLIRVVAMVMRGELRTIDVEFKNKEMRLFCPEQERGSIVAAATLRETFEEIAQELLLRWRHVSPMPKPGGSELAVKSHLAPRGGVLADTAPANGGKQPEAQA